MPWDLLHAQAPAQLQAAAVSQRFAFHYYSRRGFTYPGSLISPFKSGIRSFNGHKIVEQTDALETCKKTQFLDRNRTTNDQYVSWFREAWPYIQGHLGSTFVVVIPGEVMANKTALDGILQDISLLHGLGIKLVIVPGTHVQVDVLLRERGQEPKYVGAYRITDAAALEAAMEAAGKIRIELEAKLSRGPLIPVLRRHGQNGRWNEAGVSVAGGNFLAAKRRGVVNGVDYGATGEVRKIDVARIRERLDSNCIVLLSNLGWTSTGEVLNCKYGYMAFSVPFNAFPYLSK